mmetsp:Transcript_101055/g.253425  ORF Transcript_101055/g.253425 Transcript_101055/m.253425 type:complete len:319 (-) Transcript_101055:709-1665(-)
MKLPRALQQGSVRDDEGDVDVGGAVRHHLDLHAQFLEGLEGLPEHRARVAPGRDQGEHCHALTDLDLRDAFELLAQAVEIDRLEAAVQRQGDRDLGRGDDVHRDLELVEDLEHVGKEAVLPQHARASDDDHRNVALAAHRGHAAFAAVDFGHLSDDAGAGILRLNGIAHADGDLSQPCRQNGSRMHHLGAEGRQLGCLLEGEHAHGPRRGHDARVRGHDAADVFPDLHLRGQKCRPDHCGRKVRAVAAQRRDGALGVLRDVARDNRDVLVIHPQREEVAGQAGVGLRQYLTLRERGVGAATAARGEHAGLPTVDGLGQ